MKRKLLFAMCLLLLSDIILAQNTIEKIDTWVEHQNEKMTAVGIVKFLNGDSNRTEGDILFGNEYVYNPASSSYISAATLDASHFVIAYSDYGNSEYGTAVIGTVTGNIITYGSEFVFNSYRTSGISISSLDASHFVIAYKDNDWNNYDCGTVIRGTVNGVNIIFDNEFFFNNYSTQNISITKLNTNKFVIAYQDLEHYLGKSIVGITSGSTISFGTEYIFNSSRITQTAISALNENKFAIAFEKPTSGNTSESNCIVGDVSGTIISFGTKNTFNTNGSSSISLTTMDETDLIIAYSDEYNDLFYGTVVKGAVSGNTIIYGTKYIFNSEMTFSISPTSLNANQFIVAYRDYSNSEYGTAILGTISSNNISFGLEYIFNFGATPYISASSIDGSHFTVAYQDNSNSNFGTAIIGEVEGSIITWDGSESTDWYDSDNWEGGVRPTATDNVIIPDVTNNPVIRWDLIADCNDLTINSGASLLIESGFLATGSLITNGNITNNGTINVERYITSGKWHLISSPISDGTANTFLGDYLQYYDGVWNDITDPVTTLTPVQGYSLWDVSRATTFTFTGNLNNGDQSFGITSDNNGWNLLGNPYPSSIDWSLLDDSYGAVYYWDADNSNYISWNNGSGTGSQYVPAMQGFWINTTSNGTFTVTNAERTHNGISIYYKNKKLLADYLELKVIGNDFYDKLCVSLNSEATEHFDFHYDAFKLFSPVERVPQLYSYAGDNVLSIDVRPATEVIQLGFKCSENGNYTIGINDITNITFCVLEDTKTGLMSDLIKSDYNFNYSILDSDKRFKLHLQALGISKLSEDLFNVYANGNKIFIKSENFFNGKVTIINMMGQPVLEQKISNSKSIGIETNLSAGIYIVNVTNGLKSTSDKIIIE